MPNCGYRKSRAPFRTRTQNHLAPKSEGGVLESPSRKPHVGPRRNVGANPTASTTDKTGTLVPIFRGHKPVPEKAKKPDHNHTQMAGSKTSSILISGCMYRGVVALGGLGLAGWLVVGACLLWFWLPVLAPAVWLLAGAGCWRGRGGGLWGVTWGFASHFGGSVMGSVAWFYCTFSAGTSRVR